MKIQHIAVIFVIIILPIAMTMFSYIDSQMKSIELQSDYDAKLIDATYDAIKAFQLNTVNNRYSSVSNSKIRDIEASVKTFYNSLSNSKRLTVEELQAYAPAVVFTLYDGYYIYSKYDNVYSVKDGKPDIKDGSPNIRSDIETEEEEEEEDETNGIGIATTDFGLKPYIYYSCRYKNENKDFVVNYTLDNAITLYGDFGDGDGYKTLAGYLINFNTVHFNCDFESSPPSSWSLTYNGETIEPEVLTEHLAFLEDDQNDYEYVEYNAQKIYYDKEKAASYNESNTRQSPYFTYQNYGKSYITNKKYTYANTQIYDYLQERTWGGHLHSTSALEYYNNAAKFSKQVADLTKGIKQSHAIDENGNPLEFCVINQNGDRIEYYSDTKDEDIFVPSDTNDPLLFGSAFDENRIAVIRKSIETNLTTAISEFKDYTGVNYEFALPVLTEEDWNKITNNISMLTFLQGIPIGHKYYNNYCVINNNSNEENINKECIYIITENADTGEREYHLPGCTELLENKKLNILEAYSNISFLRQTVRVSEGNYRYFYPQTRNNKNITSCYHCMVNAASVYPADQIIKGSVWRKDEITWEDEKVADVTNGSDKDRRLKAIRNLYLHALARERYDLYRANVDAFMTNQ